MTKTLKLSGKVRVIPLEPRRSDFHAGDPLDQGFIDGLAHQARTRTNPPGIVIVRMDGKVIHVRFRTLDSARRAAWLLNDDRVLSKLPGFCAFAIRGDDEDQCTG